MASWEIISLTALGDAKDLCQHLVAPSQIHKNKQKEGGSFLWLVTASAASTTMREGCPQYQAHTSSTHYQEDITTSSLCWTISTLEKLPINHQIMPTSVRQENNDRFMDTNVVFISLGKRWLGVTYRLLNHCCCWLTSKHSIEACPLSLDWSTRTSNIRKQRRIRGLLLLDDHSTLFTLLVTWMKPTESNFLKPDGNNRVLLHDLCLPSKLTVYKHYWE